MIRFRFKGFILIFSEIAILRIGIEGEKPIDFMLFILKFIIFGTIEVQKGKEFRLNYILIRITLCCLVEQGEDGPDGNFIRELRFVTPYEVKPSPDGRFTVPGGIEKSRCDELLGFNFLFRICNTHPVVQR